LMVTWGASLGSTSVTHKHAIIAESA